MLLPSWKYDIMAEIQLHQSMHVFLKNNCAKFHPDPIWNDAALGFLKRLPQQEKNEQRQVV